MASSQTQYAVVIKGQDRASGAFRSAGQSAKSFGEKFRDVTVTLNQGLELVSKVASGLGALASAFGSTVKLAGEQEMAVARLNAALRLTGDYTDGASRALQDNAAALQQVSRYGDEAIMPVQAMLLQFGNMGAEQVPRATRATLDLAESMGMDLKGAASLVAKAVGTSTNALSRYGIEIDNSLTGSERFEAIIGQIETKVGGTAEVLAGTFLGSLTQAKNAWGDLLEKIGAFLTGMPEVQALIGEVIAIFQDWSAALAGGGEDAEVMREAFASMVVSVIEGTLSMVTATASAVETIVRKWYELKLAALAAGAAISFGISDEEQAALMRAQADFASRLSSVAEVERGLAATVERLRGAMADAAAASTEAAASASTAADSFSELADAAKPVESELEALAFAFYDSLDAAWLLAEQIADDTAFESFAAALDDLLPAIGEGALSFEEAAEALASYTDEMRLAIEAQAEMAEAAVDAPSILADEEEVDSYFERLAEHYAELAELAEEQRTAATEAAEAQAAEAFEALNALNAHASAISSSIVNQVATMAGELRGTWDDFGNFLASTIRRQMVLALLDPIIGAGGAVTTFIQSVARNFLSLFVSKEALEKAGAASAAGTQAALAAELTAVNLVAAKASAAGWAAAATAAAVATLGGALGAAAPLLGMMSANSAAAAASIPAMAEGGIVSGPTLALIGEAGPEAVVPLRQKGSLADIAGGGLTVNEINITAAGDSADDIADGLVDAIDRALAERVG